MVIVVYISHLGLGKLFNDIKNRQNKKNGGVIFVFVEKLNRLKLCK